MNLRLVAALAVVLSASGVALGAGIYPGYPATTLPFTGAETFAVDTNLGGGQSPQTESVTVAQILGSAQAGTRNALMGGDFGTNPWQRGTSPCTTVTSTVTYCADGWFVRGSAGSAITVAKQTTSQTAGFGGSLRFQRDSGNTDTNVTYLGQVLESKDSYRFQGQKVAFSFWLKTGANYSAASSAVGVVIGTGTGVDGSSANFLTGSWTGYAAATSCSASSITGTTTWTRYTVSCTVPSTAVQVGVALSVTPVGTAGTNDWIEVTGMQLEAIPASSSIASNFAFLTEDLVTNRAQRYYNRINEGATTVNYGVGQAYSTTVCHVQVVFPTTMRAAPTASITAGSFTVGKSADGSAQALTTLASTSSSLTPKLADLTATASAANLVAGSACTLQGGAGVGVLAYSAEL